LSVTVEMANAATIPSVLPEIDHVPLTSDIAIDDDEYAHIMRGLIDDNSVTPVSAFNSGS
jgi:hypothetical protein